MIRRALLAIGFLAALAPAFAQAPPPVPGLPDIERRTTYTITSSTCACAVGFQIYGDNNDYGNWIEVWLNGVLQSSSSYTVTSPTGPLASIPRPITDAVLTFNAAQTGTVVIVGARRPRRVAQFPEGRGVAARDLNQAFTDLVAQNRETWDKINDVTGRALLSAPGNTLGLLPQPSACVNSLLGFDATGANPKCLGGTGTVLGVGGGGTGQGSFGLNLPLIGNGTGPIAQGTVSGNTIEFATVSGVLSGGHCLQVDPSGNLQDSGATCGSGSSTPNVSFPQVNAPYTGGPFPYSSGAPAGGNGTNITGVFGCAVWSCTVDTHFNKFLTGYNNGTWQARAIGTLMPGYDGLTFPGISAWDSISNNNVQPAANSTLTINGTVVTFVSGTPSGNQVQIGASALVTMQNLNTFLEGSADTQISKCQWYFNQYSGGPFQAPYIETCNWLGTDAAATTFTISASSSPASNLTVNLPTPQNGGGDLPPSATFPGGINIGSSGQGVYGPPTITFWAANPTNPDTQFFFIDVANDGSGNGSLQFGNNASCLICTGVAPYYFLQFFRVGMIPTGVNFNMPIIVGSERAYGYMTLSAQPANNSTITIGGTTITFVTGTPTGNQVQIAGSPFYPLPATAGTINNLITFLQGSADVNLSKASWFSNGRNRIYGQFAKSGSTGNAYTLSAGGGSNFTMSGATFSGGNLNGLFVQGPVEIAGQTDGTASNLSLDNGSISASSIALSGPNAANTINGTIKTTSGTGGIEVSGAGSQIQIDRRDNSNAAYTLYSGGGELNFLAAGGNQITMDASGNLNVPAAAAYESGGTVGLTCSGTPTSSFASTKGIVTHC